MPEIGRFLQPDPAREFVNTFSYVGNNPVNATDPTGEWYQVIAMAAGAAINVAVNVDNIHSFGDFAVCAGSGMLGGLVSSLGGSAVAGFLIPALGKTAAGLLGGAVGSYAGTAAKQKIEEVYSDWKGSPWTERDKQQEAKGRWVATTVGAVVGSLGIHASDDAIKGPRKNNSILRSSMH